MTISTSKQAEQAYGVGIAYGISAEGTRYASLLVSKTEKGSTFSPFSIFISEDDYSQHNITDAMFENMKSGDRKVIKIEPKDLGSYWFVVVDHAPYGIMRNNGKLRFIRTTSFCIPNADKSAIPAEAKTRVMRAYERADAFAKGEAFYEDYRDLVVFDITREDLFELLNEEDDDVKE